MEFLIIAADSGWNEPALIAAFCNGLNPLTQTKLACRDQGINLNAIVELTIALDQHLWNKNECNTAKKSSLAGNHLIFLQSTNTPLVSPPSFMSEPTPKLMQLEPHPT